VAALFLRALLMDESTSREPMLSGGAKSLAASLDYALTKQPSWIVDMFGISSNGRTHAKRLFRVTNSHRKRSGPVSVSINLHVCPKRCIEVLLDGKVVNCPETLLTMLKTVEGRGGTAGATEIDGEQEFLHVRESSRHLEAA
jgi:hypothetical protein